MNALFCRTKVGCLVWAATLFVLLSGCVRTVEPRGERARDLDATDPLGEDSPNAPDVGPADGPESDAAADVSTPDSGITAHCVDGWCWVHPLPHVEHTFGIWGTSPTEVWTVGAYGRAWRFDGAVWQAVPTGTTVTLDGVSGTSGDDIWAVGEGGTILHYDGSRWSGAVSNTTATLWGVWAHDRQHAWAVGSGVVLAYDGTSWQHQTLPEGNTAHVHVAGTGPTNVWVVGEWGHHWNGTSWSAVHGPFSPVLEAAWAASSTDVWFASWDELWRSDGATMAPTGLQSLRAATGFADDDVWLVGNGTSAHWDGTQWKTFALPPDADSFEAIWGSSSTNLWAGGFDGALLHFDGSTWSVARNDHRRLWAVWVSPGGTVWAAGNGGTIGRRRPGGAWEPRVASASSVDLYNIWGLDDETIWAVGANGTVLRFDAQADRFDEEVTPAGLFSAEAVWGSSSTDVWVVGGGDAVLHFDGVGWRAMPLASSTMLYAMDGSGPQRIVAVGPNGAVMRYDGTAWALVNGISKTLMLDDVWVESGTSFWTVGYDAQAEEAVVAYDDGTGLKRLDFGPSEERLSGVWGDAGMIWFSSGDGNVHVFDGNVVAEHGALGIGIEALRGNATHLFAVGDDGAVLAYRR